jgi:hypothetical protein
MLKLLGSGKVETLEESPLGQALNRVADTAMEFIRSEGDGISSQGATFADAAMDLADMVLDLLEEMGVIDALPGEG